MARSAIKIYLKSAIESGFNFIKKRFESLGELNDNFHAQRDWIFRELEKKADYKRRLAKVLEVLKMHSCKYLGISFLTENRLCEAYETLHGETISKRSVSAYIKQLKEIGFVTILAAKREDGKQTANIVVIEKIARMGEGERKVSPPEVKGERKNAAEPCAGGVEEFRGESRSEKVAHKGEENLRTIKTSSPFKTTLKKTKERIANGKRLLNFVPKWFQNQIGCCSRDAREVFEYWKVTKHLARRTFGSVVGADEWRETVGKAVREFYLSAKAASRGKFKMNNPVGFFHSVLEAEAYAYVRRCAQRTSGIFYNWLED